MTTQSKRGNGKARSQAVGTHAPRKPSETKRARLIGLLKTARGSDVETLSRELGWQHHSTRAALTGLRKAGFIIERTQCEGGGPACYRIMAGPAEEAAR